MRYALVSDIHANVQAWKAVLLDIASLRADRILCLGDAVGYGPNPAEVLESMYSSVHHFILGNHDAVLCGKMDDGLFNDGARAIIRWTRGRLGDDAVKLMRTWPLTLRGTDFRAAHGEFSQPGHYNYIDAPEDALPSWQAVPENLLFVGHSHCPGVYLLGASGTPRRADPQDLVVEEGKRYLINVGSVGQPRDGDTRASYALYDSDRQSVYFRRIPFDLDAFRAAVEAAALPPAASQFLHFDPRLDRTPLRERLSFRPAENAAQAVRDAVDVQELTALRGRVRRWQGITVSLAALAAAGAAAGGVLWHRHATRTLELAPTTATELRATDRPEGVNLLPAVPPPAPAGQPLNDWTVRLGDRRGQQVRVEAAGEYGPSFALVSTTAADPLDISSAAVAVTPGQRLAVEALFRKSGDFAGTASLSVSVVKQDGTAVEQFKVKEPNLRRRDGWFAARESFELPAGAVHVRVRAGGRFAGRLDVAAITLERR